MRAFSSRIFRLFVRFVLRMSGVMILVFLYVSRCSLL